MSGRTHHCAGVLIEADCGETLGLHSCIYKLRDETGADHIVYAAHGRGADAQRRAQAQYGAMTIGRRYYASGTVYRQGETMSFYFGRIQIEPDQRRPRALTLASVCGVAA